MQVSAHVLIATLASEELILGLELSRLAVSSAMGVCVVGNLSVWLVFHQ